MSNSTDNAIYPTGLMCLREVRAPVGLTHVVVLCRKVVYMCTFVCLFDLSDRIVRVMKKCPTVEMLKSV